MLTILGGPCPLQGGTQQENSTQFIIKLTFWPFWLVFIFLFCIQHSLNTPGTSWNQGPPYRRGIEKCSENDFSTSASFTFNLKSALNYQLKYVTKCRCNTDTSFSYRAQTHSFEGFVSCFLFVLSYV